MVTPPDNRWSPGIGDPTVMGWVTVAAYFTALALCAICAARASHDSPQRRIWIAIACLMGMLGVNKQLDLQTWFTQVGRDLALAQGWYPRRRIVQEVFILSLATGGLIGGIWQYRVLRGFGKELQWMAVGLAFLVVFVIVRAASFNHFDALLRSDILGVRVNWVLELGGIAIVSAAAVARLLRSRRNVEPDTDANSGSDPPPMDGHQ